MRYKYESPMINITIFEGDGIFTTEPQNNGISGLNINAYGMQNYTTFKKVSHDIMEGNPTVEKILQYQVD